MPAMFRSAARAASALVIGPFLLFGSALAPQHVHEHETEPGHSHALAHSHFEPHHLDSHEDDGPEFEQGPEHVVWLDNVILHQTAYHGDPGPPLIAVSVDPIPAAQTWSATPFDDIAPAHGPPRRHPSFRGPPLPLA